MDASKRDSGKWTDTRVSFRPFPNSSGWWWLISSVFLIRISCHKTTHANGYYGAWPGWTVSISVLPVTEGLMLKLKLQCFGHLMGRADSFEKTLMLGKIEVGGEGAYTGWDGWMASPTQWTWVWINSRSCRWTGRPGMLQSVGSQRVRRNWVTELQLWKI